MSITKRAQEAHKPPVKGKASGVDWGQVNGATGENRVSWNDADGNLVAWLIYSATRRGMAVSFSATASGQAVSITILDGGDRPKWYANSAGQLDALLKDLIAQLD